MDEIVFDLEEAGLKDTGFVIIATIDNSRYLKYFPESPILVKLVKRGPTPPPEIDIPLPPEQIKENKDV